MTGGVKIPLTTVPFSTTGILRTLPPPPAGKTGWPWTQESDPEIFGSDISWPKLTIVSPSFNQGDFLEQTIRSVLLQNYPNLEYIVIDGGSTDQSKQIMDKYSPWLSYYQSNKDRGQSHAINLGFSLSSGSFHGWINSDDFYVENCFSKVITAFLRSRRDFIYGYGQQFEIASGEIRLTKVMPFIDYFIKIPTLLQPSTFWKATIHQPVWEELDCSLDYELWLRMVKGRSRLLIKESLSVANVHSEAKTHSPKMKKKWEEDHKKIWADDAHGPALEWRKIVFLNRIRIKLYKIFRLI